jgi:hypothetical protein
MKKDRPDSFEAKLQPNQVAAIERWLFTESPPLTYDQAVERIWQDFGLRVSVSGLRRFYVRTAERRLREATMERVIARAQTANAVVEECERNPAPFQKAVLELVARIAMERAMEGDKALDISELRDLCLMALAPRKEEREDRKVELAQDRLELDRKKLALLEAKEASAKRVIEDEALTPEQKQQKLRAVFGMA